ncbi:MAG: exodeoxyribonuclease VII large subunit [bacterium]
MAVQILTVSQVTNAISRVISEGIGSVSVQGEISNYKLHSSGHRYFTLKDEGASISCVMWRTRQLNFTPADGMKVIASGNITVYPQRGNYQIECTSIKPVGQGDLFIAYEALKAKLQESGYFDLERKRQIPELPMKIGVSTSPTGAAIQDILTTCKRRFPAATIYFRPTLVQGDGSAKDIVSAINELNKENVDVIIIGRGGGSLEDLWAYNMEITANAIFNSKIPIISAVGHETDFTIADFVTDKRAATPTAAAEMVTPFTLDNVLQVLMNSQSNMTTSVRNYIESLNNSIKSAVDSHAFKGFTEKIKNKIQYLDDLEQKKLMLIKYRFEAFKNRLKSNESHCKSLYPLSPLEKGFALLQSNGRYITKDETLGNFITIDVVRKDETATVSVNKVYKVEIS